MFDGIELFEVPINELLSNNGILVMWTTNSCHVTNIVNDLMHHYALEIVATWHWVKITKSGEPVTGFNPHHKVPFESFIIACKSDYLDYYKKLTSEDFLIIGTPSSIHSRKPPILPLFKDLNILNGEVTCLELFGRYLLPNTITVGYEALKLQDIRYFIVQK